MTTDLTVYESSAPTPPALFGTSDPEGVIAQAAAVARPLAQVIRDRKLFKQISGRDHVLVEGWTLLGSMLGVFPVTAWCRPIEGGWEARVEARTLAGAIVGGAEAQCTRTENTWKNRDDFALRSMAQTRATSKALRMPLGFVMALAGYETTPVEEMPPETAPERLPGSALNRVGKGRPERAAEEPAPNAKADTATLRRMVVAGDAAGIGPKDIEACCWGRFGRGPRALTIHEAEQIITEFKGLAPFVAEAESEQAPMAIEEEARPAQRAAH